MIRRKLKNHSTDTCNVVEFDNGEKWFMSKGNKRISTLTSDGFLYADAGSEKQREQLKWWAEELGIDTSVIDVMIFNNNCLAYDIREMKYRRA